MSDYDYTWKILLIGDPSTKKELIRRGYNKLTLSVGFYTKTATYKDKKVKLQIWDVDVEERFKFLIPSYCLGSNGAIIMYDITNSKTLEHVSEWIQIIRKNASDIPIMLVGNQIDLEASREVSEQEGIEIVRKYNLSTYREISTKTGYNAEKIFKDFIEILIKFFKYEYPIIYVEKCKQMVSKDTKRKFLGLFAKRRAFLKFKPITSILDIPETSYSSQLGLYKDNWVLRLYKGSTIIDTYIFKDEDLTKKALPDQKLIVGWISNKIPDISPYQVIAVGRNLVTQANFKKINENLMQKFRSELMVKQRNNFLKQRREAMEVNLEDLKVNSEDLEVILEDLKVNLEYVKIAVEKIEYLMKVNAVNELAIERKYLPEIFSVDLLGFSQDGLPTLKPFVLNGLLLKGIFTRFYGNVIKFFKGVE